MGDYVITNFGGRDIEIPNEIVIPSRSSKVVSWMMLWKILDAHKDARIVVYELGKCLLDWS